MIVYLKMLNHAFKCRTRVLAKYTNFRSVNNLNMKVVLYQLGCCLRFWYFGIDFQCLRDTLNNTNDELIIIAWAIV